MAAQKNIESPRTILILRLTHLERGSRSAISGEHRLAACSSRQLAATGLFLHGVGYIVCANCIWLAAKYYRLAACAPQSGIYTAMGAFIDGCGWRTVKKSQRKSHVGLREIGAKLRIGSQQPTDRHYHLRRGLAQSKSCARLLISVHLRLYTDDVGIGACTIPIVGSQSVIVIRPRT